MTISEQLQQLQQYAVETRRYLHSIPELSGQEYKTSAFCKEQMRKFGYQITEFDDYTGFIADLRVNDAFDLIAFRADMDALAMEDTSDSTFSSTHPGCSHNCGHDTHMTIALTTANYLALYPQQLQHNVRFIFQMAEEDMRVAGADKMVELGCMDGVAEVYALHNDGSQELGKVQINSGVMTSYGTSWIIRLTGVSAHGSTPEKGLNTITEGAKIVQEFNYIVANKVSPRQTAVMSIGMFHAGTIPNASAEHAEMRGTIRALDSETDRLLKENMQLVVEKSKLEGFQAQLEMISYPAVVNHPHCYQRVVEAAQQVIPERLLDANCMAMAGSEDFSMIINATEGQRGAMFFLGSGNPAKGITNYLHASPYYVDEDFLLIGAQIFIRLATQ